MSEIKPALTADEWEQGYDSEDLTVRLRNSMATEGPRIDVVVRAHPLGGGLGDERDLHALAALTLFEQPFGFTHSGLSVLRRMVEHAGCNCGENECFTEADIREAQVELDRIAAILPPRDV